MEAIFKFFIAAILFATFIAKGNCQCFPVNITVSQVKTGVLVQNKPEWAVTVSNPCRCVVVNLVLSCSGFRSVREISPFVLAKSGDRCLVHNGYPLGASRTFKFSYVWDHEFPFKPVSLYASCP
ncbi:TPD1 protein homolog 1-like [Mangifera indica]|uniref:TPD1 protein homolog 1-like n=1 Tax=Mangifera indica TaxID=29780 RepID=UPI001CFB6CF7|nr:TPD1 protein homolog 1-like [Mangifera indica]